MDFMDMTATKGTMPSFSIEIQLSMRQEFHIQFITISLKIKEHFTPKIEEVLDLLQFIHQKNILLLQKWEYLPIFTYTNTPHLNYIEF